MLFSSLCEVSEED